LVVEEGVSAGNTQEEPRQALEILILEIALPKRRRMKPRNGAMPVPFATMM
jgi:hypothetical protein